jgi:hypothetical protein
LNLQLWIFEWLHHEVAAMEPLPEVPIGENHGLASITEVA